MKKFNLIAAELAEFGLSLRGGFYPKETDSVPAMSVDPIRRLKVQTLLIVGNAGGADSRFWQLFSTSAQYKRFLSDPTYRHPLDEWVRQILTEYVGDAARDKPMEVYFPFDGPPYLPFLTWAAKSEAVWSSPVGMMVHARFGLWHAYRAVLVLAEKIDLPQPNETASPCNSCQLRPCLTSCPVNAFTQQGYDVDKCAKYVYSEQGRLCRTNGCQVRASCPIGQEFGYAPEQVQFHMNAFLRGRTGN